MFKPLGERVLVERLEEEKKTASGIIIPDNAKEKPQMGIVKAVSHKISEGCKCLKEGDVVAFGKYKGTEIVLGGKEFMVLELEDVLGVVDSCCHGHEHGHKKGDHKHEGDCCHSH
ncbi:co-chaperone GroES [Helicobacter bizzozeronii]|uniref:Co-chaperonin GroES n=1 Tax=Helicobacter bizzozeronii (strain CIII-1) TaxID=1002804 RepID=F8KQ17_HELBC|nr:co-chaperone GroES [Helicobacter bizzozeronii]GMB92901.1 10 kDa chaperonin [Helicobacter bizzozeronii]CCB79358.1 heat shock protein 60 family co-chaperone GroES [Helicobacter bizzozeronii CIII-1]CCF81811.1 Heat shock protein 60 family co-chaperone GroES [Helicobacter bizzozeronii CCUG 35545]